MMIKIIFCILCLIASTASSAKSGQEDSSACPITTVTKPSNFESKNGQWHFSFRNGAPIRRMAVITNSKNKNTSIGQIRFTWIPTDTKFWSIKTGSISVKSDGEPHCFILGSYLGIPENISVSELIFNPSSEIDLKEITFSEARSDKKMVTCPSKEIFGKLRKAYADAKSSPKDKEKVTQFVNLIKVILPKYDCRRDFDNDPVPAWYLCGEKGTKEVCGHSDVWNWFTFLAKSKMKTAKQLFGSKEFRSTLDGETAEEFYDASLKAGGNVQQ